MKIFLSLYLINYFQAAAYLGITIPASTTGELIKSGGNGGLQFYVLQFDPITLGIDVNSASCIILGTGNSSVKYLSVSPDIAIIPHSFGNSLSVHGRILLTRMYIENPAYRVVNNLIGSGAEISIRVLSKPIKLHIMGRYDLYNAKSEKLHWYTLGLKLEI
ncbi:MAG: hypothetical protein WBJ87_02430 [Candidatus Hydrothermia bacterium]|nr:hypothetical protein [Candidatus Hydrothermia bacterium]